MKKVSLMLVCVLAVASVASATVNVPAGMTGLWLFGDNPGSSMASMESAIGGADIVNRCR